jgi:hypothetical protein
MLPSSAGSGPLDIDPRRETNKIRSSLTGTRKERSSPYGTPKGLKSPLHSPLVSDPSALSALNLEPGVTKVPEDVRRDFYKFKQQQKWVLGGGGVGEAQEACLCEMWGRVGGVDSRRAAQARVRVV